MFPVCAKPRPTTQLVAGALAAESSTQEPEYPLGKEFVHGHRHRIYVVASKRYANSSGGREGYDLSGCECGGNFFVNEDALKLKDGGYSQSFGGALRDHRNTSKHKVPTLTLLLAPVDASEDVVVQLKGFDYSEDHSIMQSRSNVHQDAANRACERAEQREKTNCPLAPAFNRGFSQRSHYPFGH
eukprot:4587712-Prymnesium_polylepis.1